MTLKSMTGYAAVSGSITLEAVTFVWTWDLRSVNGKTLDLRLRAPQHLVELDQLTRKASQTKLARGNLQAHLHLETERREDMLQVNEEALAAILAISGKLAKTHDLAPVTLDGLLSLRGVLDLRSQDETLIDRSGLLDAIMADFNLALDGLIRSRATEGEGLQQVLVTVLDEIEALIDRARNAPERAPEAIREKLSASLVALSAGPHGLSEERLYQEALMLAAKADIREEIDRLAIHVSSARDLISSREPVGRQLDFLSQEFNREANTICSKANDIAITHIGLALKSAIDQLREQIQNIE